MKNRNRGMGAVYQQPNSALWWIRYHHRGRKYRESSHSVNHADAVRLLKHRLGEGALPDLMLRRPPSKTWPA
jgi:hypothetical protein